MSRECDSLIHSNSTRVKPITPGCCSWYKVPVIREKPAILLVIWNVFIQGTAQFMTMSYINADHVISVGFVNAVIIFTITSYSLSLVLYPLLSWIADAKIGRFSTLVIGIIFYWSSQVLFLPVFLMAIMMKNTSSACTIVIVLRSLSNIFYEVGNACCNSNIIQFVMDHMVGASAEELTFAIY